VLSPTNSAAFSGRAFARGSDPGLKHLGYSVFTLRGNADLLLTLTPMGSCRILTLQRSRRSVPLPLRLRQIDPFEMSKLQVPHDQLARHPSRNLTCPSDIPRGITIPVGDRSSLRQVHGKVTAITDKLHCDRVVDHDA
jgi:hypothetical protein